MNPHLPAWGGHLFPELLTGLLYWEDGYWCMMPLAIMSFSIIDESVSGSVGVGWVPTQQLADEHWHGNMIWLWKKAFFSSPQRDWALGVYLFACMDAMATRSHSQVTSSLYTHIQTFTCLTSCLCRCVRVCRVCLWLVSPKTTICWSHAHKMCSQWGPSQETSTLLWQNLLRTG